MYVYILRSLKDGEFYIGISKDPITRLREHNRGETKSTKNRVPFVLIYKEKFNSYKDARIREKQIKSYKGGNSFKKLIGV